MTVNQKQIFKLSKGGTFGAAFSWHQFFFEITLFNSHDNGSHYHVYVVVIL